MYRPVTDCSTLACFSKSDGQTAFKCYEALEDVVSLAVQNPAVVAAVSGYVLRPVLRLVLRCVLRDLLPGLSKSCKARMAQQLHSGHLLLRAPAKATFVVTTLVTRVNLSFPSA